MSGTVTPIVDDYGTVGTYGHMQARIADEVLGGATTTQIQGAIQDAISDYQDQRFWFNECRFDQAPLTDASGQIITDASGNPITGAPILQTVPKQEFYPIPVSGQSGATNTLSQIAHFDRLVLLAFYNRYSLIYKTPQWMDDESVGPYWYALPQYWSLDANQIRFYPIPDQSYPVYVAGTQIFPLLVNSADTNPWMIYGERLIRARASQRLYRVVLRNPEMAQVMEAEVQSALAALLARTAKRGGPLRFRAIGY